jgi:outer membrane protein TolC
MTRSRSNWFARWSPRGAVASTAVLAGGLAAAQTPTLPTPRTLSAPAPAQTPPAEAVSAQTPRVAMPAPGSVPAESREPDSELGPRPLPITLPIALKLVDARSLDVALAAQRVRLASAVLDQANVLWLPSISAGMDYNRHDGRIQDVQGNVITSSRSNLMFGVGSAFGAAALISPNEAYFAPLVARRTLRARRADLQAASNDLLLAVATAYFNVEQARGDLAGARDAERRANELVTRIEKLAPGIVPQLEATRAETEQARRQQAVQLAKERWQVASAELVRILRLDPTTVVDPVEPPHLRVNLIDPSWGVDQLVTVGLTYRPELASRQAQVQATLALLRQERLRPLIPSVLLRGSSTPVTGTLGMGVFGGGTGNGIHNSGYRGDLDVQVLWQFDNLGFGNRARIRQQRARHGLATLELFRMQDMVAAEVASANAQAKLAAKRVGMAEREMRLALDSYDHNLAALSQTRRVGNTVQTVVRPQEVVAALKAYVQAYTDYYAAVADANRAQFRLYRALGQPAQCVLEAASAQPGTTISTEVPVTRHDSVFSIRRAGADTAEVRPVRAAVSFLFGKERGGENVVPPTPVSVTAPAAALPPGDAYRPLRPATGTDALPGAPYRR